MGTFVNADLSLPKIGSLMGPVVASWFSCSIQIVDPRISEDDALYNPFTNVSNSTGASLIWEGPARIKPIRFPKPGTSGFADTEFRMIQIQVSMDPANQGTLRKGLQVYVTDGGNDPTLMSYQYVIRSAIGGSDDWIRTIEAGIDTGAVGTFGI
jgi:hypothetical protein